MSPKTKAGDDTLEIPAEGAELHVRVAGSEDAPPLVLLHGFPLHGGMWDAQVEAWSADWRVIVPDFRGHGRSGVGDGQYAIDFFVDDLFALLDATTEAPAVACGLSMGGYVLLRAIERERARFRALILADTRSHADNDDGRLARLDAVRTLRREGAGAYAEQFVKGALGRTSHAERPQVVEAVAAMAAASDPRGLIGAQLAMAARTDTSDVLGGIEMPTLVVVGEEDTLTPPDNARELATRIRGARLTILPGAGHLTPLEIPAEFNAAVGAFLASLSDAAG